MVAWHVPRKAYKPYMIAPAFRRDLYRPKQVSSGKTLHFQIGLSSEVLLSLHAHRFPTNAVARSKLFTH